MQMDLNIDTGTVTILNGTPGEIVKYIGSNIWRVRYMQGSVTLQKSFINTEIDFNGQDITYLQRTYI